MAGSGSKGGDFYLKKTATIACDVPQADSPTGGQPLPDIDEEDDCLQDDACLVTVHTTKTLLYMADYHIVYSISYAVPVLYFNIFRPDGSLLPLETVWDLIPQCFRDRLEQERWTFLTQQEHPLLQRPFYQLHPCHTTKLIETAAIPAQCNYVVSWLSFVGPVVGLSLPMSYAGLDRGDTDTP